MKNVFQRAVDPKTLRGVPVSDYSPGELASFLTTAYPNDPMGALRYMRENYEVGILLGEKTEMILEGMSRVKAN